MEDFASASSSQFTLTSDLPSASSTNGEALEMVGKLEGRLVQNFIDNVVNSPASRGSIPQVANSDPVVGMSSLWPVPFANAPNNASGPDAQPRMEKVKTRPGSDDPQAGVIELPRELTLVAGGTSKNKAEINNKTESPRSVELEGIPPQNVDDPKIMLKRPQGFMERTQLSQKQLQV